MRHRNQNIKRLELLRYWFNEGRKAKQGLSHDEPAINTEYYNEFLRGMR